MTSQLITAQNGTGKATLITGIIASYALDLYHESRKIVLLDRGADYHKLTYGLGGVKCIELTTETETLNIDDIEDIKCLLINYPCDTSNDEKLNSLVLELIASDEDRRCIVNDAWAFNKDFLSIITSQTNDYVMATVAPDDVKEITFDIHVDVASH